MSSVTTAPVPSAVFDGMIYLQAAARETGPAAECFRRVQAGECRLFASPTILAEVADVLLRPAIRKRFPGLVPGAVAAFLDAAQRVSRVVTDVPRAVLTAARR